MTEHDKFVFRNDSAGLGVPRGTLGKLNSFSNQTAQHGMASTNVYYGGAQRGEAEHGSGSYAGPASSGPSPASASLRAPARPTPADAKCIWDGRLTRIRARRRRRRKTLATAPRQSLAGIRRCPVTLALQAKTLRPVPLAFFELSPSTSLDAEVGPPPVNFCHPDWEVRPPACSWTGNPGQRKGETCSFTRTVRNS